MSASQENYKINLEIFEGPLDLLLHLIKKNQLEIYDIPIVLILDQYLEYLDVMKELDIDLAGEFIFIASELSHIKSKLLLRKDDDQSDDEEDPRADLIARLLEYQKYKRAADWLQDQPLLKRDVFKRPKEKQTEFVPVDEMDALSLDSFKLLSAFKEVLKNASAEIVHEVEGERISVTERIYQIVEHLKLIEDSLPFEALFTGQRSRGELVVTFLAILEMARLKMIHVYQSDAYGDIRVKRKILMDVDDIGTSDFDEDEEVS